MAIPIDKSLLQIGYRLNEKLRNLEVEKLQLSKAGYDYFQFNLKKINYVQQVNVKIIEELLKRLNRDPKDLTIVDHGGGIGFWSFLLKEIGIGTVVYHDISKVYLDDLKKIGSILGLEPDYVCLGDSEALLNFCSKNNLNIDGLGSRNVIEHVPSLSFMFSNLEKLTSSSLVCVLSTSANTHNPIVRWQHRRVHKKYENVGTRNKTSKELVSSNSGIKIRADIIAELGDFSEEELTKLAKLTRGLRIDRIRDSIHKYISSGILPNPINHPTNTCNPINGSWVERLIRKQAFEKLSYSNGFSIEFIPGFYNESYRSKFKRLLAKGMNFIIPLSSRFMINLSPYIMFSIKKN